MGTAQDAYDRIVRPLEGRMIASIWRIVRDPHDAEDALQNALAILWKRFDRLIQHPALVAFVLRICIDAALDVVRRRKRLAKAIEVTAGDVPDRPMQAAPDDEVTAEIVAAIKRLSPADATAVLMRLVEGQSYEQIAAATGSSEAAVRKRVSRARRQLQEQLTHLNPKPSRTVL